MLDLVQEFYTEERLMTITHDQATGESETFAVNQPNPEPETGEEENPYQEIINDLTLGEYDVVVSSVPQRETLEDSQFEQAMAMREAGIMLPDSVYIDSSRLMNKKDIIKQMQEAANSPEAQAQKQLQTRGQEAEVAKTEVEAQHKAADAGLKQAKTEEVKVNTQILANGEPDDGSAQAKMAEVQVKGQVAEHKMSLDERLAQQKMSLAEREHQLEREKLDAEIQMKERDMQQKRMDARVLAAQQAATAAAKPPAAQPHVANRSRQPTVKA